MKEAQEGQRLRVFVSDGDRWHGRPLHDAIVLEARGRGLAGATVLRGIEGYGAGSRIHTTRVLARAEALPVVIEIVDTAEKIQAFLPLLDGMIEEGLVTVEPVRVVFYRHRGGGGAG